MNIRQKREYFEQQTLSKYATLSVNSKGRDVDIEPCEIRTVFQRDRDRIIHSKSFRRLKHKTQVFLAPTSDHYRTRLTHTLEVSQIARTIAASLWLNEDLTEAIALGHDLGHTPFGHAGERALNSKYPFKHNEQSLRVVEVLENNGQGLNLTWEVRDGIVSHGMSGRASTLEGRIVRLADKIAYINHDMDDAIRAGILKEEDIPKSITDILGKKRKDRLDLLVKNIVNSSMDKDDIYMDPTVFDSMVELQKWLTENLYFDSICKVEEIKVAPLISQLYDYYLEHLTEIPEEYFSLIEKRGDDPRRIVCDYISGMTDFYAVDDYQRLFIPSFWGK